jgi:hypothetical protein
VTGVNPARLRAENRGPADADLWRAISRGGAAAPSRDLPILPLHERHQLRLGRELHGVLRNEEEFVRVPWRQMGGPMVSRVDGSVIEGIDEKHIRFATYADGMRPISGSIVIADVQMVN